MATPIEVIISELIKASNEAASEYAKTKDSYYREKSIRYKRIVDGISNLSFGGSGVTSFNTRTGAVTLTSSDVITALGYTPSSGTPTLDQVTTAGNTTSNAIEVGGFTSTNSSGVYSSFSATTNTSYPRGYFYIGSGLGDSIVNAGLSVNPDVSSGVQKDTFLEIRTNPVNSASTMRFLFRQETALTKLVGGSNDANTPGTPMFFTTQGVLATTPAIYIGNTAAQNVIIGSSTDAGYKLDVNGSAIVRDYTQIINSNSWTSASDAFTLVLPNTPSAQNSGHAVKVRRNATVKLSDRYGDSPDVGLHVNYFNTSLNAYFGRNYSNLASTGLGVANNSTGTHDFTGSISSGITTGGLVHNNTQGSGLCVIERYNSNNYTAATDAVTYGVYSISTTNNLTTNGAYKRWVGGYFSAQPSYSINNDNAVSIGVWGNAQGGQFNYAGLFTGGNVGIGTTAPEGPLHVKYSSATVPGITIENDGVGYNAGSMTLRSGTTGGVNMSATSSGGLYWFNLNTTSNTLSLPATGNLIVGGAVDAGYRLDVKGGNARFEQNVDAATYSVAGNAGYSGIINFPGNPPGSQNLEFLQGILINVF